MKVPEYNPQVDQVTPQIPETRFSAPPQAAFGEQVDQANENLGKSYEKIGEAVAQHVERQNILQRRIGGHVAEAQVKSDIINHLNDPTPKEMEYKDFQGNKITKQVPSGELLQKDDEAQDAYKSGASYIDDRVTELLKKSDPYEQQRIQFTLLPWAEQQKAHLAEHQQVQTANYYKKSLKTVASGIADDTTVPVENTIASLEKTVPDFVERYHGEDADTQVQKYMLQSARNRVDAQLMADPKDEGKLADITDAFSSKLSDEQMLNLKNHIDVQKNKVEQGQIRQQVEGQISSAVGLYGDIATGKKDVASLNPEDFQAMNLPEQTQIALNTELRALSKGRLKTDQGINPKKLGLFLDDKDQAFAEYAGNILKHTDQAGMVDAINKLYHGEGRGKIISQDHMNILTGLMIQRSKNLPIVNDPNQPVKDSTDTSNVHIPTAQVEQDGKLKELLAWQKKTGINDPVAIKTYVDAVSKGQDPKEAQEAAMHSAIVKRYPGATPGVNVVVGANSPARYILPMQTKEEPKKIYNPKTRRLEPNPKYKAKDENAKDSK